MKPKALYVGAFAPQANGTHAGARAAHGNIQHLLADGYEVDVVVCSTESRTAASESAGCEYIPQSIASFASALLAHASTIGFVNCVAAPIVHARLNSAFIAKIESKLLNSSYELLFVDFTQAILPALIARKRAGSHISVRACLHDIYAQKHARRQSWLSMLLLGFITRAELDLLRQLTTTVLLNAKDASIVHNFYSIKQTSIVPYTPPDWCTGVRWKPDVDAAPILLFYGNFQRIENAESTRRFLNKQLPEIANAYPSVRVHLLGTAGDEIAKDHSVAGQVTGLGFVNDPSAQFAASACVLAPLTMGAGVKFKVLDSIAAGVPVIGTDVAFEGIDCGDLTIEADLPDFARAVCKHLQTLGFIPVTQARADK